MSHYEETKKKPFFKLPTRSKSVPKRVKFAEHPIILDEELQSQINNPKNQKRKEDNELKSLLKTTQYKPPRKIPYKKIFGFLIFLVFAVILYFTMFKRKKGRFYRRPQKQEYFSPYGNYYSPPPFEINSFEDSSLILLNDKLPVLVSVITVIVSLIVYYFFF